MLKAKYLIELCLFTVIFLVYAFCTSTTINFWDSPEFIASNYTMQASHPPGAPLYTIVCTFILSLFSAKKAALASNLISVFFGAFTCLMVYKTTYFIIALRTHSNNERAIQKVNVLGGLLAALSLAFSTSFWTLSTETEVYSMSFALMVAMIYILLNWYTTASQKREKRFLLLFFFFLGISVSIHLILITIVIPASVLFVYKTFKASIKNITLGLLGGTLLFLLLYGIIIRGLIKIASTLDVYTVNSLKFPVNYGAVFVLIGICISLISFYILFKKKQRKLLSTISLVILIFLMGPSLYLFPILRSDTNSLVAEKVNTTKRLEEYISAKRFGVDDVPLIYGPTYNAQLDNFRPFLDTEPILTYDENTKKYIEVHNGISNKVNYSTKFKMLFPRMYDKKNATNYAAWTHIEGEEVKHKVGEELITFLKPTFSENIDFFINYQLIWLNLRYLFWNFVGKQNDYHGLGYIKNGNWTSGFRFIDKRIIGEDSKIPKYYKTNKANDQYYFLPFILGLLGFIALLNHKDISLFLLLLFLTFGIGITIYINPLPSSILIRERDYIFTGSFIIFSIWIGLSLTSVLKGIEKITTKKQALLLASLLVFLASPFQLLAKGWDNHQNSNDYFAYNFGKAYLDSCPEQAILITNGDNMTFPLWYLQEVENYRTDVRVINFDQLNIDTHIDNLKKKKQKSIPLDLDLDKGIYINGIEKVIPLKKETEDPIDLEVLTQFLNSDKTLTEWNGRRRHYIPGSIYSFAIDTTLNLYRSSVSKTYDASLLTNLTWRYKRDFYNINSIVVFNIIKNNLGKRPICFANIGRDGHLVGLNNYLVQTGMVSELLPIKRKNIKKNPKLVDTKTSYKILVENSNFIMFNSKESYIKDENRTYAREILRQQYYFLAQALFEEEKVEKAKNTLDKCLKLFSNKEVPFKQYAFAIGKLYLRMGYNDIGNNLCKTAMENVWSEFFWVTSFDTPNPIINVRHANKLLNTYQQMISQIQPFNEIYAKTCNGKLISYADTYNDWYKNNWPY